MKHRTLSIIFALILTTVLFTACAAQDNSKKLTDSGITVTYPAGMDVQAKEVMQVMKTSAAPSLDVHRRIVAFLSDPDKMATEIADLFAAPEKQDETAARLRGYRDRSRALVQCFSNVRLLKKTDAVATEGIDAGLVQVRYNKDNDEFKMAVELKNITEDALKRTYFPVLVNPDGSIRSEAKLDEIVLEFLGAGQALIIAPVHETITYIIIEQLKLYQPFTRWFNEGVSGWVTRYIVTRTDSKLAGLAQQVLNVSDQSKQFRDKVNLYAWPQKAYQNIQPPAFDPALEAAHTHYAIELIDTLLGKNGAQNLPKIMIEINYNTAADTQLICDVIKKVTGKDAFAALMDYVPADIKKGADSGEAPKLIAEAEKLTKEKKWNEAADKLRRALQMNPNDVNARLNLAWLEREVDRNVDAELQVFLVSSLLKKGDYSFKLFATSIEGNYILGRLAILMGNLEYARKFLEPVLALNPDHKDAKRALAAIDALEKGPGAGTSSN